MSVFRPILPFKAGYVEIEEQGQRVYQNVQTGETFRPDEVPTQYTELQQLAQQMTDLELLVLSTIAAN